VNQEPQEHGELCLGIVSKLRWTANGQCGAIEYAEWHGSVFFHSRQVTGASLSVGAPVTFTHGFHVDQTGRRIRCAKNIERICPYDYHADDRTAPRDDFGNLIEPTRRGVVLEFRAEKGWGLIESDDRTEKIWVHHSDILADGFRTLSIGDHVSYERSSDESGRVRAVNVRVESNAPGEGLST
jgi:CspA family cold shock protein